MNELIELPYSQWPKLRDLYKDNHNYACSYQMIQIFIDWIKQEPELEIKIFTLNGDWEHDGTFIVVYKIHVYLVYMNTLSENLERLTEALKCLRIKDQILFSGVQERVLPALEQHYLHFSFDKSEFEPDPAVWLNMPKEDALRFEVNPPEGITLRRLQLENAEKINIHWPYHEPGSIRFVEQLIRGNLSVGAFDRDGDLVAWCLRLPLGSLGMLHVMDTHRRQGLGSLVVRYMARNLAKLGFDVTSPVMTHNVPSKSMFKKLGFKEIDLVCWAMRPAIV